MAIEIIEMLVWITWGFGLGVLFVEVRMSLFGRIASMETALAAITAAGAGKIEGAAEDIGKAIETVSMDAFNAVVAEVESLKQDLADLKAAIGSDADAAPIATAAIAAEGDQGAQDGGPAHTESTGS